MLQKYVWEDKTSTPYRLNPDGTKTPHKTYYIWHYTMPKLEKYKYKRETISASLEWKEDINKWKAQISRSWWLANLSPFSKRKSFRELEDAKEWVEKEVAIAANKHIVEMEQYIELYSDVSKLKLKKFGGIHHVFLGKVRVSEVQRKTNGKFVIMKPNLGYGKTLASLNEVKEYFTNDIFPREVKKYSRWLREISENDNTANEVS